MVQQLLSCTSNFKPLAFYDGALRGGCLVPIATIVNNSDLLNTKINIIINSTVQKS